jgi:hypothetical protein
MELFSEIYSCYYQVLRHLLSRREPVGLEGIRDQIQGEGFEESILAILPKLENGAWKLFEKKGDLYYRPLCHSPFRPGEILLKSTAHRSPDLSVP